VQDQNSEIVGNPNFDDGDRNFSNGSIVTNRIDCTVGIRRRVEKETGLPGERRGLVGQRLQQSRQHEHGNGEHARRRTAGGRRVVSLYEALRKRRFGRMAGRIRIRELRHRRRALQRQGGPAHRVLGRQPAAGRRHPCVSYSQNSLDVWKGFATPGAEAKELFRPRGGLTLQAQPLKELSLAGQWFYNWQAIRVPESGSYLTVNDGLQFGGDSTLFSPNPYAALVPGAPAYLRLWNENTTPASRYSSSLGDWGLSARWSPQWLDGTLGFYYRNTTDIAPQVVATLGAVTGVPAATCTAIGGTAVPGACVVNKNATTPDDLTKRASSEPTAWPTATISTLPASRWRKTSAASRSVPSCPIAKTCRSTATR
jgi:hypothetical protein